ncbi:uncharacterized protein LOC130629513 [Hydractinia symbiolongicarpus]|uniref:uncharacterized protein LOC130629513 n=1 Tax=Hydractinia symbiolongicarpus TaxID=13093 RepID=UPI00254C3BAC|nr:uncharacterized protein LOC130629513 [Hydractinia symbiolongicarpus]
MLHRAGRITASVSKSAFTCDLERTKTLVDTVMQYKDQVDVVATRYGKRMETRARDVYTEKLDQIHTNFQVKTTGLHINTDFPYLAASPDGIVQCDCHSLGLKAILPKLVTRKGGPNLQNEEKLYCLCRRPSFPPMIGCDNFGTCDIEWYHYSCVNITRAPKKSLCPNCSKKI